MLSSSEQTELVDLIKSSLRFLLPTKQIPPSDVAILLVADVVRTTMKFEHARLDDTDQASCGKGGIAAETEEPEQFTCPHCHRKF